MSESPQSLIRLEGVKKIFYTEEVETHALAGVHLDIRPGEYVAIGGPSGCGKSTLLSILGLLDTPTEGAYTLNGRPVQDLDLGERARIRNREIGFIFQSFNLIGDLTVFENVELPLTYRGMRAAERRTRVNDALEGETFLLMGPGRWGTNDPQLGVKVHYADINHCRVLIEIAHRRGEYVPEVSYGTHFFQDLVEDGIYYLALHPDEGSDTLREGFFLHSPNALASLCPRDADLARFLHVIRVSEAAPGRSLHLAMDGEAQQALCYLE